MDGEIKLQLAPIMQGANQTQAEIMRLEGQIQADLAKKKENVINFGPQKSIDANKALDEQIVRRRAEQAEKVESIYKATDGARDLFKAMPGSNPLVVQRVDQLLLSSLAGLPPRAKPAAAGATAPPAPGVTPPAAAPAQPGANLKF
jgi:hypothetical protein